MSRLAHSVIHLIHPISWLHAADLGANDGILSTSSLTDLCADREHSEAHVRPRNRLFIIV